MPTKKGSHFHSRVQKVIYHKHVHSTTSFLQCCPTPVYPSPYHFRGAYRRLKTLVTPDDSGACAKHPARKRNILVGHYEPTSSEPTSSHSGSLYVVGSTRYIPVKDGKSKDSDGENVAASPASEYYDSSKGYERNDA